MKASIEMEKTVNQIKSNIVKEANLLDQDEINLIFTRQQETSSGMIL